MRRRPGASNWTLNDHARDDESIRNQQKELTQTIDVKLRDETGRLQAALREMNQGPIRIAAKEIKLLIDDSVSKVAAGSRLVDEAGATMTDVVASVHRVASIVREISAASQERSAGIDQINRAVMQMDEAVQQNSAMVEEAAAAANAANALRDEAGHLARVVSAFSVEAPTAV
ncbi:methyl-accepting chemotaxis protein [Paraburkholderia sp. 40]